MNVCIKIKYTICVWKTRAYLREMYVNVYRFYKRKRSRNQFFTKQSRAWSRVPTVSSSCLYVSFSVRVMMITDSDTTSAYLLCA